MESLAVWFEIPVLDMERARRFYSALMNTDIVIQESMGVPYGFFSMEGYENGGALVKRGDCRPGTSGVTLYLNGGKDLSVPLSRVEDGGGRVLVPKTLISEEIGYYALFLDTEGNRLGLYSPG